MMNSIEHIVLADDDIDDIELFSEVLIQNCPHIKLSVANNGKELLELLATILPPDLILLDLSMPLLTGQQCLLKIRAKPQYNHVPIAIYSTSSRKEEIEYCLENGANLYLIKPNTYSGISELLKDMVEYA